MGKELIPEEIGQTKLNFQQLNQLIKNLKQPLKKHKIEELLSRVVIVPANYTKFIEYNDPYGRVSVIKSDSDAAEMLILTWQYKQQSLIHDHYLSSCGIRVIEGILTERIYDIVQLDQVKQNSVRYWNVSQITSSNANYDIHRIENSHENRSVSLHIYSPPLDLNNFRRFVEVTK